MLRQCLGLAIAVAGCTTSPENAPVVPDAAGMSSESTTGTLFDASPPGATEAPVTDSGPTDAANSGADTSDSLEDGNGLTDDTTTSPSAPQTTNHPTGTGDDAGADATVSCDTRKLRCRRAEPSCDEGYVPRIIDGCYAECVPIDDCECNEPDACPQNERYTCNNSSQRCTPYLL